MSKLTTPGLTWSPATAPGGEKAYVNRTKDQIKDAPEYDAARQAGESDCLERSGRYYGQPHS
ncbi:hypothetical protein OHA37_38710 [Streptomyces sp. NBC_00335]|uniref:hypothetical protein n=1 Tax=unclassified Streptomyces TaxID=2593676 RepID=UPI0022552E59|nr:MULTISPECIES: hypothetical protein [unclassified Streptomyces]MCX5409773.1 hypothetical protein [Streptomyces sp. NBC_00086]